MIKKNGFGLIEAMVAVGILGILSIALMDLMVTQNKEVKAIGEKMLSKNIETSLKNLVSNSNFCSCLFRGYTFNTIPSILSWNRFPTSIPDGFVQPTPPFPSSCTPLSSALVPRIGSSIPGSSVKVSGLQMAGIVNQGSGNYTGNLVVKFDSRSMTRAVKDVSIPVAFSIDQSTGTPAARNFSSCGVSASASGLTFLNSPVAIGSGGSGTPGWQTYNVSALVPPGTKTALIETFLQNNWRVGGVRAKYRRDFSVSAADELWLGISDDNDSQGHSATQGFFPLDPSNQSFQYKVETWGDGGSWEIRLIGFVAP